MTDWLRRCLHRYLQACARWALKRHKPLIVGITGTAGKTTTKEMLGSILREEAAVARHGQPLITPGNMNDDSGVPLTVLGFKDWIHHGRLKPIIRYCLVPFRAAALAFRRDYPRLLVLEFGTHKHGHLHELVRVARPHIGVVTNVGAAHLETLGSIEGVAHEKSALVRSPPKDGAVILGAGHPFVDQLASLAAAPVTVVEGHGYDLNRNIATAIACKLGLGSDIIERGLAKFSPPARRLQRHDLADLSLIDDSHNANPISMPFALETLKAGPSDARKVALLGTMAELGDDSEAKHVAIGQVARATTDLVVGVGEAAKAYRPDHWYEDADACCEQIWDHLKCGDLVLVKGSASSGMQSVADFLLEPKASC